MKVIRKITHSLDIVKPEGMTRVIKFGVLHCTAGPQNQTTEEIFNYWKKHNGWKNAGYHFDIGPDGTVEQYVEIDQIANGVEGHNQNSIHLCYKGGIDKKGNPVDNRTDDQKAAQLMIVMRLKALFPNIVFLGHRDFSTDKNGNGIIDQWEWIKSCPAFDVRTWLENMYLDKAVIPERIVYKLNFPLIRDNTVRAMQTALGLKIDGFFGADTDRAVRAFQEKLKIKADGVVGEKTAAFLEALIPAKNEFKGLLPLIKNHQ